MKKPSELTNIELCLRSLVYAIETKDIKHKNHLVFLGENFLQHKLKETKETMIQESIPIVKIDKENYHI